jgi:serine/threonine protein kinase
VATRTGEADLLLAGRYRLLHAAAQRSRTTLWRGLDETLNRPVAVKILDAGDEVEEFLSAAVAAGRLGHPRIASTYDAAVEDDIAYVVSEWVEGRALSDVLHDGPLSPARATTVVAQVTEAVLHAHQRGVHHLDLDTHNVIIATDGTVKVTDFALGRAVSPSGTVLGEPELLDVQALGAVLYACLTARSAFGAESDLPLAPRRSGMLCTPRQVRAAVPRELDLLVARTLLPPKGKTPPITTAAAMLRELAALPGEGGGGRATPTSVEAPRERPRATRWIRWGVPALGVVIVGALSLAFGYVVGEVPPPDTPYPEAAASAAPEVAAATPVKPVTARDFDPDGDGVENRTAVQLAFDRDPSTTWETSRYRNNERFGGLKPGVGLVFDLGTSQSFSRVDIAFSAKGVGVELRAADTPGTGIEAFRVVASSPDSGTNVSLKPAAGTKARYWVVWVTKLVRIEDGRFQAGVAEVSFLT